MVEDWEQHFVEKSRRRFEKERAERRRSRLIAAIAIGFSILAGLVGLAVLR